MYLLVKPKYKTEHFHSRWNKTTTGHWIGVIQDNVWRLKQTDVSIECEILPLPSAEKDEQIFESLMSSDKLKLKNIENVSKPLIFIFLELFSLRTIVIAYHDLNLDTSVCE